MPKFKFRPEVLRRCFALAKVVKPQTNDLCLRFIGNSLVVFSSDKRRYTRAEALAEPLDQIPPGYTSDDFYITLDRSALFDSDLDSVTITVNEKSLSIHTLNAEQSRQASLKKRSMSSRRPSVPARVGSESKVKIGTAGLDLLLKQVSCSAMIRETKTEEDMRVNQVHFYGGSSCAVSNARYYGSVAFFPSLSTDMSIVSNDVPLIKSFLGKIVSNDVFIFQDTSRLYVEDPNSGSILALSKVNCNRPPLSLVDREAFTGLVLADQPKLAQSLEWALLALEGTQRVSIKITKSDSDHSGILELSAGNQELSKIPVVVLDGRGMQADFPVRFLSSIVRYVGGETVAMRFGHPSAPTIMELSQHPDSDVVKSYHYLQGMKERK